MDTKNKIIIASTTLAVVLIFIGMMTGDTGTLGNIIIIAVFVSTGPYFLYRYSRLMWLRSLEQQFPNFVRDLADSSRSGMSFAEAIRLATKAHYGKLSPEIEKINNRLSWGTPFLRTLDIFGKDVKDSKPITEALEIIRQSYESGGSIAATLDSVARDMVMLKEAEAERSSLVKQQVMIMYGIFFMFLGISIMIIYVMVPMIKSQADIESSDMIGFGFTNPCCTTNCQPDCLGECIKDSQSVFPCSYFSMVCSFFNAPEGIGCYYLALFFTVVMIQGLFTGLISGQLGENSVISGAKHSMIMMLSSIGIFIFLAKAGLLII